MKNDIKKLHANLREIEDDLLDHFCHAEVAELEDRYRQSNVRTDGIPETSNETWGSCEDEVRKIIKNKLDITDDIEIDRCHRIGKFQRNKSKP